MKIVGIAGNMGSGKDTVAGMLKKQLQAKGMDVAMLRFAGPLKRMATFYFGWDGTKGNQYVSVDNQQYFGGRDLLQGLGNLFRNEVDKDYWIKQLRKDADKIALHVDYCLIPDCRFINEAKWIKAVSGRLIYVSRPGHNGDSDPSETEMNSVAFQNCVDMRVTNDQDLKELEERVSCVTGYLRSFK